MKLTFFFFHFFQVWRTEWLLLFISVHLYLNFLSSPLFCIYILNTILYSCMFWVSFQNYKTKISAQKRGLRPHYNSISKNKICSNCNGSDFHGTTYRTVSVSKLSGVLEHVMLIWNSWRYAESNGLLLNQDNHILTAIKWTSCLSKSVF